MLNKTRDVKTGRFTKHGMNFTKKPLPKAHVGEKSWWQVTAIGHSPSEVDGHTFEVCLINIGPNHSSPTWPVLAFFNGADAVLWQNNLVKFARTIDPVEREWNKEFNGDDRVSNWLVSVGFHKVNHIWWTL